MSERDAYKLSELFLQIDRLQQQVHEILKDESLQPERQQVMSPKEITAQDVLSCDLLTVIKPTQKTDQLSDVMKKAIDDTPHHEICRRTQNNMGYWTDRAEGLRQTSFSDMVRLAEALNHHLVIGMIPKPEEKDASLD